MKIVAAPTSAWTAACICSADCTSTRRTPSGVGRWTGPATSVTSAPASRAARAIAKPILPDEWLVMPRTASIASKVGPAVTSTWWPASRLGWNDATRASSSWAGSSMRPSPVSPQACSPCPTGSTVAPSAWHCAMLRCVAGWAHISRFIAGASSKGARSSGRARQVSVSRSAARPCASWASRSALAGATRIASASRPRLMCGMLLGSRASHWLSTTGRLLSACSVTGVMNCAAASVISTCTVAPALTSKRHSSADL